MKNSIKNKILNYLKEKNDWIFGGNIDDFIRQTDGHKASNSSRRCRELENEGLIERRLVKVNGLNVVQYRIMGSGEMVNSPETGAEKITRPSYPLVGSSPASPTIHPKASAFLARFPTKEVKKQLTMNI